MVNAWRRALHKFDPPDLLARENAARGGDEGIRLAPRPFMTKREEEMEQAKADGLQVAFGEMGVDSSLKFGVVIGEGEKEQKVEEEIMEEEEAYRTSCLWNEEKEGEGFLEEEVGYDSDDDIL